jgi:hypothetical protein
MVKLPSETKNTKLSFAHFDDDCGKLGSISVHAEAAEFAEGLSKYSLRSLCTLREVFQTGPLPKIIC